MYNLIPDHLEVEHAAPLDWGMVPNLTLRLQADSIGVFIHFVSTLSHSALLYEL
jgi:hypothetical protein